MVVFYNSNVLLINRVEVEESFSVDLKSGYTIHSGSPPGSGIVLAFILRVLDGLLPAPNPGLDAQRIVEAFKFGYGERSYLGDHKFVNVSGVCTKIICLEYYFYFSFPKSEYYLLHNINCPKDLFL